MVRAIAQSVAVMTLTLALGTFVSADDSWRQFRGHQGSGSATAQLPETWDVATGENVAWQADLPGRGVSGPIVVGGRVIVTASSGPNRDRLHVLAFDSGSGEPLWHRQFWATGRTLCHETSANAAPTPASDGERVFAFYSSSDLVCLDLDGEMQWMRGLAIDHPGVGNDVGMSASPAVAGEVVVVQCECQANSFAVAYDQKTGEERWTVERPPHANWTSPVAIDVEVDGKSQPAVALLSNEGVAVYAASNGQLLWEAPVDCGSIPSASAADGVLYVPADGMVALATDKTIEANRRLWSESQLKTGSPSPVLTDGQVLIVNRGGILVSASPTDGSINWRRRLGGRFWATPVAAGQRLFAVNNSGEAYVVDLKEGEIVANNNFGEDTEIFGSPAIAGDALYVRSHRHLWKIAAEN